MTHEPATSPAASVDSYTLWQENAAPFAWRITTPGGNDYHLRFFSGEERIAGFVCEGLNNGYIAGLKYTRNAIKGRRL